MGTAYVAFAGLCGVLGWSRGDASQPWVILAILSTVPAFILCLPIVYVVGAAALNMAGDNGPFWPAGIVYGLMFAGIAALNVRLVTGGMEMRRAAREGRRSPSNW